MNTAADKLQLLRDLQWAVHSPSLLSTDFANDEMPLTLDTETVDAGTLANHLLLRPTQLVGRYFEQLIHFYLMNCCQYSIVAHGHQVQQDGRTLGEIDFLFRDANERLHHWETTVKFFLHYPREHKSGSHLIGPNPADNFESKISRLRDHQLPLSDTIISDVDFRKAVIRGRIFYHIGTDISSAAAGLSPMVAPGHLRGRWLYASEVQQLPTVLYDTAARLRLLQKPYWLSNDVADICGTHLLPVSSIVTLADAHFRQSRRPLLISVLQPEDYVYREETRLFVVDDLWPHK